MPGQLCIGHEVKNAVLKNSKAYCEGRTAGRDGIHPENNPHADDSDASIAWLRGMGSWFVAAEGPTQDCCDLPLGGGEGELVFTPDIVGMTEVLAIETVEAIGLTAALGTGNFDPVVSQDPVAGTLVSAGYLVIYNLTA